jgi:hypothetical protein
MFVVRRATRWLFPICFKMGNCFLFKEILPNFWNFPRICRSNNNNNDNHYDDHDNNTVRFDKFYFLFCFFEKISMCDIRRT